MKRSFLYSLHITIPENKNKKFLTLLTLNWRSDKKGFSGICTRRFHFFFENSFFIVKKLVFLLFSNRQNFDGAGNIKWFILNAYFLHLICEMIVNELLFKIIRRYKT